MKVGFVGTILVFRQQTLNGVKLGQIDVVQYGDHRYPTQTYTIDVLDSGYVRVLLEVLEEVPTPLIRCILKVSAEKNELKYTLLELVSVNESLIGGDQIGGDQAG